MTPDTELPTEPTTEPKKRSGGPRTAAGKARSALNSIRHGLTGRIVVLPGEDMGLYLKQSKELVDSLAPKSPIESKLAQTIADGYWRLDRFRTVDETMLAWGNFEEAGNFDADNEIVHAAFTAARAFRANSKDFVNLSIYESRIQRGIDKAMKQLQELQHLRRIRERNELDEAIRRRHFHDMLQRARTAEDKVTPITPEPYDPKADEFVCSTVEIDREIRNRQRHNEASLAAEVGFDYKEYLKKAA